MSVCKSVGGIEYSITDIHVFYRICVASFL